MYEGYFSIFAAMSSTPAKDFLLNEPAINLAEIARLMWPTKNDQRARLSKKLHNIDKRNWLPEDEALAMSVLKDLGHRIEQL